MSKYIKREDAIACARAIAMCYGTEYESEEELMDKAQADMEEEPIIDIVHCKECIHNGSIDTDCPFGWKDKKFNMPNPNDYCSYGERKEE